MPRWIARLMLSAGMFSALAAATAPRSRGIDLRITAALTSGHGDFPDQAREDLFAFGIERAFFVLDCGPFRVAGHGYLYCL